MSDPILDTMVLQALGFGHPRGLTFLLSALGVSRLRVPPEIYSQDEISIPLDRGDRGLSEFGKGIRFASRIMKELPSPDAARYQRWLANMQQINRHIEAQELIITPLKMNEVQTREELIMNYGIGKGEAACLSLAQRETTLALFVSSDERACQVAREIEVPYMTLFNVLDRWITICRPTVALFDEFIEGMESARFGFNANDYQYLRDLAVNNQ